MDGLFGPDLGVTGDPPEHVLLDVRTHGVLNPDMGTLLSEVRFDHIDGLAVSSKEVSSHNLTPSAQAGSLDVEVCNLGLATGKLLGLVGCGLASGTVDARHCPHYFRHVSGRCINEVCHNGLRPCVRHGPGDYSFNLARPDVMDVAVP